MPAIGRRWVVGVAACLMLGVRAAGAGATQGGTLPTPPPGWRLDVVAQSPIVRHPTVVCSAADGRVFVAEDPMDISAPRADLPQGRILCLHPDGRRTTFADGLFAVFGMQYLEGKLYVLHNPRLSVFEDGGETGRHRVDLIARTNPNPWALDWNDHVPANFRLAIDGFLYVAVGDKGVFGAVGRDGKRVDLHGGGILRLRPDGTELEVYSTGVRNILDVALDAEDEIFTYDNTDEHNWMSRLTHMVDGGFYGYPYDFLPRRPYTLWMIADYGGGAATGATCYTEDALPPEYQGNLFLADFGKRQVLRVSLARAGATFRAEARQDLFTEVPEDFRPVGIGWSADGLSLYICDWQHADTKEAVTVGRLLRLTYAGRSRAQPKPPWFEDVALGRPGKATREELLRGLSHPSRSVRDLAQRRLARREADAVEPLKSLLGDTQAPIQARRHAVWALDAIDGGASGRPTILESVRDPIAGIRRQAIRQLGSRRVVGATAALLGRLKDPDASVRFQAATALGRIGDSSAVPALIAALDEPDPFARYAAFTALNRIGRHDPTAWAVVIGGLEQENPSVREGVRLAARETYDLRLVEELASLTRDGGHSAVARRAALGLLAGAARRTPAWKGEWWAYHPALSRPPARSETWAGTSTVLDAVRCALDDADAAIRTAAVEGLRQAGDTASAARLRDLFRTESQPEVKRAILAALGAWHDPGSRSLVADLLANPTPHGIPLSEAIAAAEGVGGPEVSAGLERLLASDRIDRSLLPAILTALGRLRSTAATGRIITHARADDPLVRKAVFQALVGIGGQPGRDALVALTRATEPEVRRDAVTALGDLGDRAAIPALLAAYADSATRTEALSALARIPDPRGLEAYLEGLGGKDASLRESCRRAIAELKAQVLPAIEARADRLAPEVTAGLQQVYDQDPAARRGRLFARGKAGTTPEEYLEFLRHHPGDPARGRPLFLDRKGLGCGKCHRVGSEGGEVGPDLNSIGLQYHRVQLAESVLYPSRAIREGYQAVTVATTAGRVLTGLVRSESPQVLVLRDADGRDHAIPTEEIDERRSAATSLMPAGLQIGLSLQEFADLIAFLESLRTTTESGRQP